MKDVIARKLVELLSEIGNIEKAVIQGVELVRTVDTLEKSVQAAEVCQTLISESTENCYLIVKTLFDFMGVSGADLCDLSSPGDEIKEGEVDEVIIDG